MCKGAVEEKHGGFCRSHLWPPEDGTSRGETGGSIPCELCGLRASLYCLADKAYLCRKCDQSVHKANFLAFRHVRCFLCNTCQNLSRRYLIGASVEVTVTSNIGT
ncbi:B-box domain protein 31-like [Prosopis cineraria]|uniref:B-box domain protein 31-like n=1 Tax=Prosopis cineraria TaxID=364024 RepID=UPI0024104078|nr:B-box domain protein 31-like [Prosopis cineraria]